MAKELNINQIEKIKKIYERVKSLDENIGELEKLAILVSDKQTEINVTLSVKDMGAMKKETTKVKFDEDGSIVTGGRISGLSWILDWNDRTCKKEDEEETDKYTSSISWAVSDKSAFRLMGMLMQEKKQERDILLKKLQSYGFKI
jgi:hypothetical protein